MGVATIVYGAITIGTQLEGAYFQSNPNSIARYFTIGGHLSFLNDFLGDDQKGPRLGDLQLQESSEGAPINRCIGPENRVAGVVVWMSDLEEVKQDESGGGKGGSGGAFITYQYFSNVLLKVCRAREPVSRFPKIWADGKLFFEESGSLVLTSNKISARLELVRLFNSADPFTPLDGHNLVLESDLLVAGSVDLSTMKSGNTATVSGFTGGSLITNLVLRLTPNETFAPGQVQLKAITSSVALQVDDVLEFPGYKQTFSVLTAVTVSTAAAGTPVFIRGKIPVGSAPASAGATQPVNAKRGAQINNGVFEILSASKDPNPSSTQLSRVKLTDPLNRYRLFSGPIAVGPTITVDQFNPEFKESRVEEIHFLKGGPDQAAHPIIEEIEGANVDEVYAMRFYAGILFQRLNLTDFGNRIASFETLLEERPEPAPIGDAIRLILEDDAGIPSAQIDTSLVTGTLRGYTVRGPLPAKRSLPPLMAAFNLMCWERGGVLFFANTANLTTLTIPTTELGAHEPVGAVRGRPLLVGDPSRDQLPSEVLITYRSADAEFQTASKRSKRTEVLPVNVQNVDFGLMVLNDDQAQQIADRLLAVAWGGQRSLTARLPQSRIGQVREGMILNFSGSLYGQTWKMMVERLDRGANMLLIASGHEFDENLLAQTATTEGTLGLSATGNSQEKPNTLPAHLDLNLLDLPALSDQHRSEPGIYIAARSYDAGRPYRGGVLYWSTDDGVTWKRVTEVAGEAVVGTLVTPPSISVVSDLWDRANTIRVKIWHPQVQLGGVTEDECLAGRNRFAIGREIIGAARVVFVESDPVDKSKTYDLSVLLRGQQDTDQTLDEHVEGEVVVWLDGPGIQYLPLSYSHVDKTRTWKLVPQGGFIEDAIPLELTPAARNCRPFFVRDIRVSRDGSNNITWTWERASRAARTFLVHGEPLDEEIEQYEIDVVKAGAVVRTMVVTGARTGGYTAAQGLSDSVNTAAAVTARFVQISQGLRRGQETEVTL